MDDIQTMSKESLLDTLSVLDKAERIYEEALKKKNTINSNWQRQTNETADKQYKKRVWEITGIISLPIVLPVLMDDINSGGLNTVVSFFIMWGINWLFYKLIDKIFNIQSRYHNHYLRKHTTASPNVMNQLHTVQSDITYNQSGLQKLAASINYPDRYLYNYDPARLFDIVSVGRADTFKEALNVLETDKYHDQMKQTSNLTYQSAQQAEMEARAAKGWAVAAAFFAANSNRR
ncbi:hypothetical protein ACUIJQ_03470 [Levilactobacillus hammesii]|uniref:Uncharacterized protein n=1 Tax=Levilactobacillus hammesii DSM 16381 TaxID=1423753 RepID=A0A0R1URS1_9LACO|nr:hypothetical protein [Levilactobacillus hammesii]KRL94104.1 hypothetical protein FD28_GL000652 [Levilactobacillus hammesii DSM 16381]